MEASSKFNLQQKDPRATVEPKAIVKAVNREPDVPVTDVEVEPRDTEKLESATSPETSSTKDTIKLTVPAVEDVETAKKEVAKEAGETKRISKVKPSRRPRPRPPSSPRKNLRKKASPTKNTSRPSRLLLSNSPPTRRSRSLLKPLLLPKRLRSSKLMLRSLRTILTLPPRPRAPNTWDSASETITTTSTSRPIAAEVAVEAEVEEAAVEVPEETTTLDPIEVLPRVASSMLLTLMTSPLCDEHGSFKASEAKV